MSSRALSGDAFPSGGWLTANDGRPSVVHINTPVSIMSRPMVSAVVEDSSDLGRGIADIKRRGGLHSRWLKVKIGEQLSVSYMPKRADERR